MTLAELPVPIYRLRGEGTDQNIDHGQYAIYDSDLVVRDVSVEIFPEYNLPPQDFYYYLPLMAAEYKHSELTRMLRSSLGVKPAYVVGVDRSIYGVGQQGEGSEFRLSVPETLEDARAALVRLRGAAITEIVLGMSVSVLETFGSKETGGRRAQFRMNPALTDDDIIDFIVKYRDEVLRSPGGLFINPHIPETLTTLLAPDLDECSIVQFGLPPQREHEVVRYRYESLQDPNFPVFSILNGFDPDLFEQLLFTFYRNVLPPSKDKS